MAKGMYVGATTRTVTLTNMVDAINGTTGFTCSPSSSYMTASNTHTKYSSNSIKLTGTTSYNEVYASTTKTYALNSTHIYYARVETYQETVVGTVQIYFPIAEPVFCVGYPSTANTWNITSGVNNRSSFTSGNYQVRFDYNNLFNSGEMWFDGLMLIDLTACFGAGKEPDKAWCDANIPYFTGTKTIQYQDATASSVATKVGKMYIGVNNVARKVRSGYVGVNNVARTFMGSILNNISSKTEINSGGGTTFDVTINSNTLKFQIATNGKGTSTMDRVRCLLYPINVGDVIEYSYDLYINTNYTGGVVLQDWGALGGSATYELWLINSNTIGNGLRSYTRTFTVLDGYNSFYHTLYANGAYVSNAYIDVKSIKINGEQVFPC